MAANRLEKARKAFLYVTDFAILVVAVQLVVRIGLAIHEGRTSMPVGLLTGVCDLVVCTSFARSVRGAMRGAPRPAKVLLLAGALGVAALLLSPRGDAGAALYVPLPVVVGYGAAMTAAITIYYDLLVGDVAWWTSALSIGLQAVVWCGLMRIWLFLWRVLKEAHQAQEAKTMLAVSEERLRFARDLHDLLGHSLSVITVKSELAAKLVDRDPDRAVDEMTEVRRLAKESLREVRTTVQGYRELDLRQELQNATTVLEAAGVRCEIRGEPDGLPPYAGAVFAWVVREGATNVLKHSTAARCVFSVDGRVIEIRNDGIGSSPEEGGSGVGGLAERLDAAGGRVSTHRTAGEFVLRAELPA